MKQLRATRVESSFGKADNVVTTATESDNLMPAHINSLILWKRKAIVCICSLTLLFEGFNLSLPGPFFPNEAERKGLSQSQIGLVVGCFDLANLVFSFVVASTVKPNNIKFFYSSGMLWSSLTVASFGILGDGPSGTVYFVSCMAVRIVNGMGASMLYSTALPIAAQMFPEKSGMITSVAQISIGLGLCIGPTIGSALVPLGGYRLPFITVAVLEFFLFLFGVWLIPSRSVGKQKTKINNSDYIRFLLRFGTLSVLVPTLITYAIPGVRDSSYSKFFQEKLGMSEETASLFFTIMTVGYLIESPIVGILVEYGYGAYLACGSVITAPLIVFGFFVPKIIPPLETVPWVIFVLFLNGSTLGLIYNPSYMLLEKVAVIEGFTNMPQTKAMAASAFNLNAAAGRSIGSFLLGGLLNDHVGFYYMILVYSILLTIGAIWYMLYLFSKNLVRKLYYDAASGDIDLHEVSDRHAEADIENEEEKTITGSFLTSMARSDEVRRM